MSAASRFQSIGVGIHVSTSDFSTMPSTSPVIPRAFVPSVLPRRRDPIERGTLPAINGQRFANLRGAKNLSPIELPLHWKGANAYTGGAVTDWEARLEQGRILAALFGAVAPATTGTAATASGTAGATLTASSGTGYANGDVIMFTTTTGVFIRRITSGGGTTTFTLNQAASGTASGSIIRLARYTQTPGVSQHLHLAVDAESVIDGAGAARRQYLGCMASKGVLTIPNTGLCEFDVTLLPTDWQRVAPNASPTFADATYGDYIAVSGYEFMLGANKLDARNLKLTVDNAGEMRPTGAGPNGVRGGVAAATGPKVAMLEGEIFLGASVPGQELQDNAGTPTARDLLGDAAAIGALAGTQDLMLSVPGTGVGGASMGIFMPAADVVAEVVQGGNFNVLKFTAYGSGATPLVLALC
ncbi:MAG: hypothetical protein ACK52I_01620 [Pseudomonadota bacterium]|jgi:hypothetical protein